jgi:hypothetical protein
MRACLHVHVREFYALSKLRSNVPKTHIPTLFTHFADSIAVTCADPRVKRWAS